MGWSGHYWTIAPRVRSWIRPQPGPVGETPWRYDFEDPEMGPLTLPGLLADPGSDTLVVLVHGLGGTVTSTYMVRFANVLATSGLAWLRLGLRGSDRQGGDFYHAGLSGDLDQVMTSPALAHFEHIVVVGFSLGGHLALRFATHVDDPRVRAIAAVCAPVDLDATVSDFDEPGGWVYRRYILRSLWTMVEAMGDRLPEIDREALSRVETLRGWDGLSVVARFGFDSAEDYYRKAGVVHRLDQLRRPCLLVAAEGDPMVSARSIRSALEQQQPPELEVHFSPKGGHVGFPPNLDLGLGPDLGLESQVLAWLRRQVAASRESQLSTK